MTPEHLRLVQVPQESIPEAKDREVKQRLLRAFAGAVGLDVEALRPCFMKAQLWGAAVPMNVLDTPCVFDADANVGICGDWLISPSIEVSC